MSATQQASVRDPNVQLSTGVSSSLNLGGQPVSRNVPQRPANEPANEPLATDDASSLQPSRFASRSSLMVREVPKGNYKTTCWFEPLGYCQDGFNRNCWCSWHMRHFFNGLSTSEYVTVMNKDRVELISYSRMLCYIPMPFRPSFVRVFPIIEMFQNMQQLENALNFGMMQYTLKYGGSTKHSDAEISKIIAEHKAYFLMMMEVATNRGDYNPRRTQEIPPIVRLNTAACVDCLSNHLLKKQYNIHLVVANEQRQTPLHMDLRLCTAFTQSIVLLFDLPYGFPAELNKCLAMPPAYMTYDNYLVADESKLHLGTYRVDDCSKTFGSQCTIMTFRLDSNGEIAFFDQDYKIQKERCVLPTINRNGLFEYLFPKQPPALAGPPSVL